MEPEARALSSSVVVTAPGEMLTVGALGDMLMVSAMLLSAEAPKESVT